MPTLTLRLWMYQLVQASQAHIVLSTVSVVQPPKPSRSLQASSLSVPSHTPYQRQSFCLGIIFAPLPLAPWQPVLSLWVDGDLHISQIVLTTASFICCFLVSKSCPTLLRLHGL